MDKPTDTETIESGSNLDQIKPIPIKIGIPSFPAWSSAIKRNSANPIVCKRQVGNLTQRPKGPIAVLVKTTW